MGRNSTREENENWHEETGREQIWEKGKGKLAWKKEVRRLS